MEVRAGSGLNPLLCRFLILSSMLVACKFRRVARKTIKKAMAVLFLFLTAKVNAQLLHSRTGLTKPRYTRDRCFHRLSKTERMRDAGIRGEYIRVLAGSYAAAAGFGPADKGACSLRRRPMDLTAIVERIFWMTTACWDNLYQAITRIRI